jgi:shikimate kinase
MNIYLIGMPGSGKTTLGKQLAFQLHRSFIDLDAIIEKNALAFIDEIFALYGEKTFRKLEKEALISYQDEVDWVIACGGGVILDQDNKKHMKGLVIYLETDTHLLKERLKNDYQRPILMHKSIELLRFERESLYLNFADLVIKNNGQISDTLNDILSHLKGMIL